MRLLSILVFTFGLGFSALAQWIQTNGPEGGNVLCIERVNNAIWAGTYSGVYVSNDDGLTWQRSVQFTSPCTDIRAYNDTVVLMYYTRTSAWFNNYEHYIITSFNNGLSWNSPYIVANSFMPKSIIAIKNKSIIINNVYTVISHDLGLTWNILPQIDSVYPSWIVQHDDYIYAAIQPTGTYNTYTIFRSSDFTNTWDSIITTHQLPNVTNTLFLDSTIILTNNSQGNPYYYGFLLRSLDYGTTWDTVLTLDTGFVVGYFKNRHDTIFAFTNNVNYVDYRFFSIDKGNTWLLYNSFPILESLGDTIVLANGDFIETSYKHGIIRHVSLINSYFPTTRGLSLRTIYSMFGHKGKIYINASDSKEYFSVNGGSLWNDFIPFVFNTSISDMWFNEDTIIATLYSDGIAISIDNGITWNQINCPTINYWSTYLSIEKIGKRLYYSSDTISYSDDFGITWNSLPQLPQIGITTECGGNTDKYGTLHAHLNNLFITTGSGYVFKLDTSTSSWNYVHCFSSSGTNNNNMLVSLDSLILILHRNRTHISHDNGMTWNQLPSTGLPVDIFGDTIFPKNIIKYNNIWIALCENTGIIFSDNLGQSWQPYDFSPTPFIPYGDIIIENGILYSGSTNRGVWRRSGSLFAASGEVYHDLNNNGIRETGEEGIPNNLVYYRTSNMVASTDSAGFFVIISDVSDDTLRTAINSPYINCNPSYYVVNGPSSGNDFGIYVPPGISDFSVDISSPMVFRPGFSTNIFLTVKNKGSVIQNAELKLILDPSVSFVSSSQIPAISGDTLKWTTGTLDFWETNVIQLLVQTPPSIAIGDSLTFIAMVNPLSQDILLSDNNDTLNSIVVGSYDPNDKQCEIGSFITPEEVAANKELEYIIRFENTGTYQADNIHIADTLDNFLDFSTFRLISSSHPVEWTISGNATADFYFNNIMLPPTSQDEINSHGFVKYGIRCKNGLQLGNAITNTAGIYFDFNPPIITNTHILTVSYSVLVEVNPQALVSNPSTVVTVYPNPTNDILNIKIDNYICNRYSISFYNTTGKCIHIISFNGNLASVDLSLLENSLYIGYLTDEKGSKIASFRFIKN
jgi:hypothetical protein